MTVRINIKSATQSRRYYLLWMTFWSLFFSMGCQLVNNSINGSYNDAITEPTVPVVQDISFKVSECVLALPEALPYTCDLAPELVFEQSFNTSAMAISRNGDLRSYAASPSYELVNNTCPGLVITSAGVLEGQIAKADTETCSTTIRATLDQLVVDETISLTISPSLTISFDQASALIEAGIDTASVNLVLSAPVAFDTYVDFDIYGNSQDVLTGLAFLTRRILIPKGQTVINLILSVDSSVGLTKTVFQTIKLRNGSTQILPKYSVVSYPNQQVFPVFSHLSGDWHHTCGIAAGELYCWGRNSSAQVGNGDISLETAKSPQKIGSMTNWTAITANGVNTCGIAGTMIYCWGGGTDGVNGNGSSYLGEATPTAVSGPVINWSQVSGGGYNMLALDNLGQLYSWGRDEQGSLGNGVATADVTVPTLVGSASTYAAISMSERHACAITIGGNLECWGDDSFGQVGNGATTGLIDSPSLIDSSGTWTSISAGSETTCGIDNGFLRCWGNNSDGTVGDNNGPSPALTPQQIGLSSDWLSVSLGRYHACGINDTTGAGNNNLFCWGDGVQGALGLGLNVSDKPIPTLISGTGTWQIVAAGEEHSCGVDNNQLFCWGAAEAATGIAGAGQEIDIPTQVGSSATWTHVTGGYGHSCGLDLGRLYCWGSNSLGQIGVGNNTVVRYYTPTLIGTSNQWTNISVGLSFSCGIIAGELYCWGSDTADKLGNTSTIYQTDAPAKIGTATGWQYISAGLNHACGIESGKLYCWGSDTNGQVGNNLTTGNVADPILIEVTSTWEHVSAGVSHTCGINAGALYCWGTNASGELGSGGSAADVILPLLIDNSGQWTVVVASYRSSCGLRDGQLFCWGLDDRGQAGNGSGITGNITTPQQVGSNSDWQVLSLGLSTLAGHYCAIRNNDLYCWGNNSNHQVGLGDLSLGHITAPTVVDTAKDWQAITIGDIHGCGLTDGRLFCWGSNQYSQSGAQVVETTFPTLITDY